MARITGTSANNILNGTEQADTLLGREGDDRLDGRGGNDRIDGGDGNDFLIGGAGIDLLIGRLGDDIYVIDNAAEINKSTPDPGTDTVRSSVNYTLGSQQEHLILTGSAGVRAIGNSLANELTGNSGANRLDGRSGNDLLAGSGGADTLIGGNGDDLLYGGSGNDTLNGGSGNDLLNGGSGTDRVAGGSGDDVYYVDNASEIVKATTDPGFDTVYSKVGYTLGAHQEMLVLTGAARISGTGNSGNNTIIGNAAANTLRGGGGNDLIFGGDGADRIFYDENDSTLVDGGASLDTLVVTGAGTVVDLARLNSDSERIIQSIETIDLASPGGQTVIVDLQFVEHVSNYSGAVTILGTSADKVVAEGFWVNEGTTSQLDHTVTLYRNGESILLVQRGVDVSELAIAGFNVENLDGGNGFKILMEDWAQASNTRVSMAGDINGDGYEDLLLGIPAHTLDSPDPDDRGFGAAYLVFGGPESSGGLNFELSLTDPSKVIRLGGEAALNRAGCSVSDVGDFNGDGYDDFIIGANGADRAPFSNPPGAAYVVFGGPSGFVSTGSLADLDGSSGFKIMPGNLDARLGSSVSSAGDVNGDGLADLIVGAPLSETSFGWSGVAYVVYGTRDTDLFEGGELRLTPETATLFLGTSDVASTGSKVSAAGDLNGDGFADIFVGAYGRAYGPNAAYVVFGKEGGLGPLVSAPVLDGENGFSVGGVPIGDGLGLAGGAAGDINGDGFGDLVVGTPRAGFNGEYSGAAYVIFGSGGEFPDEIDLLALDGADGFRIIGEYTYDYLGLEVNAAGDFDGDGFNDLIVTARTADANWDESGSAYVIFGSPDGFPAEMDLSRTDNSRVFQIVGEGQHDYLGNSVSGAGDVNGDGFDDLIVSANPNFPALSPPGIAYVIYGHDARNKVDFEGTSGNDHLAGNSGNNVLVGGDGNDLLDGGAGNDVLIGGAGNDILIYGQSDSIRIDGGSGVDTLRILAGNAGLDLTAVNASEHYGLFSGIEVIDLAGAGVNTLALNAADLLHLSDSSNSLRVTGSGTDVVTARGTWTDLGYVELDGKDYRELRSGEAILHVEAGIGINVGTTKHAVFELSDLDGSGGFRIPGASAGDNLGFRVSFAGDINGDGYDDVAIGARGADPHGNLSGATYVIFGDAGGFPGTLDVQNLNGANGFVVHGIAEGDTSSYSIAAAGDVNGDGIHDLIIGADKADSNGVLAGQSYVIFGRSSGFGPVLELSALDASTGMVIDGAAERDYSGMSVSSAGDVNGDGIDDLLIGAFRADPNGDASGASYVVFGSASGLPARIGLSTLDGSNGFALHGIDAGDNSGRSVASAGDVNGDGYADLLIGARGASPHGGQSGESYIVFGHNGGFAPVIDLAALDGTSGVAIHGISPGDFSGNSVAPAGDINGDGFDDIIIGAYFADSNGSSSGESYVVFGRGIWSESAIELAALSGGNGFVINGAAAGDFAGHWVSSAGDVNADGYDDLLIGADRADPHGDMSGAAYVLYGKVSGFARTIDLSSLDGTNGFVLRGINAGDMSGSAVSAAGDLNGDGFGDLTIGAFRADPAGFDSGEAYVFFGGDFRTEVSHNGTVGNDVLIGGSGRNILIGGGGDDFLDGSGGNDVLQGGAGDDILIFDPADTLAVDGGSGTDTLKLVTVDADIDLTAINLSEHYQLFSGIEVIDLEGAGANTLTLDAADLLRLSDTTNVLQVLGDASDAVVTGDTGWANMGSIVADAVTFEVYRNGQAQLWVQSAIDQAGIAPPPAPDAVIELADLNGADGFQFNGEDEDGNFGWSLSAAGDLNGDGYGDFVVGAPAFSNGAAAGAVYVVYGRAGGFPSEFNVTDLGAEEGYRIEGVAAGDGTGFSVAGAGDVNGDGFADLIIGAYGSDRSGDFSGGPGSGAVYVLFGSGDTSGTASNLGTLSDDEGFWIPGALPVDALGTSVSGAGDFNGDGIGDLIIGAPGRDFDSFNEGAAYVIFGSRAGFPSLREIQDLDGHAGFRIGGVSTQEAVGQSVASAGDINGDGFDDVAIGAIWDNPAGSDYTGKVLVLYGSADEYHENVDVTDISGNTGFVIEGVEAGDFFGVSVSSAGDVNGDGLADLLIGAHGAQSGRGGSAYVLFGSVDAPGTVDLSALDGSNGFRLAGFGGTGWSVSGAGDVDGDGIDDLLVASPGTPLGGDFPASGGAYLVYGRSDGFSDLVDLDALDGTDGFVIVGEGAFSYSGRPVSAAGDINGDGFADILVGAYNADVNGYRSGSGYVIFGRDFRGKVDFQGTAAADELNGDEGDNYIVAGGGDDILDGGGGNDVLRGGAGDDILIFDPADTLAVDGDTGSDTLRFDSFDQGLDLTAIPNLRYRGIESIDLTGTGANELRLDINDVLFLPDAANVFLADGTRQLMVLGDADDTVVSTGQGWIQGANVDIGGSLYTPYTHADIAAQLLVAVAINETLS